MTPETLVFYASSNPGKIEKVRAQIKGKDFLLLVPGDKGDKGKELESLDVAEIGQTLEENAKLKVVAYRKRYPNFKGTIIADDTGLFIKSLNDEPGIHTRRWKGYRMTDQQIVDYCMEQMKHLSTIEERAAEFRTIIAVNFTDGEIQTYEGTLQGHILIEPQYQYKREGFPFMPLFHVTEWGIPLAEHHTEQSGTSKQRLTHRGKALNEALIDIKLRAQSQ